MAYGGDAQNQLQLMVHDQEDALFEELDANGDGRLGTREMTACRERLAARDIDALLEYRRLAPDAARAHPEEEHLLPLFVALGAGGDTAQATRFHAGIDDYVLAMDAWAFVPSAGGDRA